jgi:oxygen-dependent protoporphyrinogen oxidase
MKGFAAAAKKRKAEAKARGVPDERPGKMWSLPGGLRVLVEALTAQLKQAPIYGVAIRSIEKTGDAHKPAWRIGADGKDAWEADGVVLTCPAYSQAAILAGLDADLAGEIGGIAYNRVAVVALGYRQTDVPIPLDGFGFIAPQRTRRDLLGVQWCSSIYPGRAPAGCVLLRALCGGWHRAEIVDWDDARLVQAVRAELRLAMRINAEPIFHKIVRWDKAIPQYHLGHLQRVAAIEARLTAHPGLFLGGNAYHGVALNDCTEQGDVIAQRVAEYCARGPR